MKRKLPILLIILVLSLPTFYPAQAITKNDIKNSLNDFFETDEVKKIKENERIQKEKKQQAEERNKQLYDGYFSEVDNKYKKLNEDLKKLAEHGYSDDKRIQKEYNKYLNNKNNMEYNRYLCDMTEQWIAEYKSILKSIDYEYKQAYEKMRKSQMSGEDFQVSLMEYNEFKENNPNLEGFKLTSIINEKIKTFDTIDTEVSKYSYKYEQKKVANFMATHKRKKLCGQIANLVYVPAAGTPQIGCLYSYNIRSDFPLMTTQVLPNGIFVTGDYSLGYASTMKQVFIQTNKKFVANQTLRDYSMYEYIGVMHYRTVLGAQNAVWKFRQLNLDEIKKNFDIGNPLYFYQQY